MEPLGSRGPLGYYAAPPTLTQNLFGVMVGRRQHYMMTRVRGAMPLKPARRKNGKFDWTEGRLHYVWSTAGLSSDPYSDSIYLDVFHGLSIINRKLHPQGQVARIKNMRVFTQESDGDDFRLKIGVLPRSWVMKRAWVKSKAMFDQMNALALMDLGGTGSLPKWHDYKIYFNANHMLQSGENYVTPVDMDNNVYPVGEWEYADFADSGDTSDNYEVYALGDHTQVSGSDDNWSGVGLIRAYAEGRLKPQAEPALPSEIEKSPWGRLFGDNDQVHDVVDHLDANNDLPPYDLTDYPGGGSDNGGVVVHTGRLQEYNMPEQNTIRAFEAPCGLIRIEIDAKGDEGTISDVYIEFEVEVVASMED